MPDGAVLIAEDEAIISMDLKSRVMRLGYNVCGMVSTGEEAVRSSEALSPDLVLMDTSLKGEMDGIEAAQRLRDDFDIPTIFLSTSAGKETLRRAKATSPLGYLIKPFGDKELRAAIEIALYRHNMERHLVRNEERFRSLVENTPDGYFVCNVPSGRFLFLSQAGCDLYGYTKQEAASKSIWDMMAPEEHERIRNQFKIPDQGKVLTFDRQVYKSVRKDGSTFLAEVSSSVVAHRGEPAFQGFIRDMTARERVQKQSQEAQKMEAIGRLAGGISHAFNNLLMVIQGNVSLMLFDFKEDHPHYGRLKTIQKNIRQGADLTKQLLGFARGGRYQVRPTDLNYIIRKTSEMFGRSKEEITVHTKYYENLWAAEADSGQIEQVLLDIYVNAGHAMPGGGDLYIETENVVLDKNNVTLYQAEPGRYVKISVTDTGTGMDENTQQRIFDPFFTTKEMGRGTGLGLASVYGIIRNHDGYINVSSKNEQGTTFNIYLPASERAAVKKEVLTDQVLEGTETILLVDDEEMVLDAAKQIMETLGYAVLAASNGMEAIKIYEKSRDRIDLVVLDMIMPGMSGSEVFDRLRERNPNIKVLLSTGYSIDGQAGEILDRGCSGFIQKPFDLKQLSWKIREVLDKK